jgi:hypothetical protein
MIGRRSRMILGRRVLVAGLALWLEGAAIADEPQPEENTAAPDDATAPPPPPGSAITTVPAPPPTPAPLLPPRGGGVPGAPAGADPDPPILSVAPDPRFGDAGQVTLNGALSASVGHLGYDSSDVSSTNLSVEPAFDYFVSPNFSQGASAFFRYTDAVWGSGVKVDATTVGAIGRIGGNVWLGGRVSFWPRLGVGAWRTWLHYAAPRDSFTVGIDGMTVASGSSSRLKEDAVFVELQAPFLFHVAPHFFVGLGPDVYADVLHSVDSTHNLRRFVGASSTVGGWF